MLDERTIMVAAAVAQVLMAVLAFAVRRSQGHFANGLSAWSLGLALMSTGIVGSLIGNASQAWTFLAVNNGFYLGGMALLGWGLMQFLGRQPQAWHWLACTASVYAIGLFFSMRPDQASSRIAVFMLLQIGVAFLGVRAVVGNHHERASVGALTVAAAMLMLGLAGLTRMLVGLADLSSVRMLHNSPLIWGYLGVLSLSQIVATVGLILMSGERIQRRLRELASHDSLTGLLTRGGFNQFAQQVLASAKRDVKEVGFLMIDIDHFKKINDRFGHATGDAVLAGVAKVLDQNLREIDIVSRYGGEEFAVLLPNSDAAQTAVAAERLRTAVQAYAFSAGGAPLQVTVSIGCANAGPAEAHIERLYTQADQALYEAKRTGRNRVSRGDLALPVAALLTS